MARLLRAGKGVNVPKFGSFTFSSSDVDLAVSLSFKLRGLPIQRVEIDSRGIQCL